MYTLSIRDMTGLLAYREVHNNVFGAYPAAIGVTRDAFTFIWNEIVTSWEHEEVDQDGRKVLDTNRQPDYIYIQGTLVVVHQMLDDSPVLVLDPNFSPTTSTKH